MQKKLVLKVMGGLGCAAVAAGGCVVAVVVGLFWWVGPIAEVGPDMWYELPGQAVNLDMVECQSGWEGDQGEGKMYCEELATPPSLAFDAPTGVEVHFDERGVRAESLLLEIRDYQPRISTDEETNSFDVALHADIVAEVIETSDNCTALYSTFAGIHRWDCGDLVYASIEPLRLLSDDQPAYLMVGQNFEQYDEFISGEGTKLHQASAQMSIEAAEPFIDDDGSTIQNVALVDQYYLEAYFFLIRIPEEYRTREVEEQIEMLEERRSRLAGVLRYQREAGLAHTPLPAGNELVHIPLLVGQKERVMKTLLGPTQERKAQGGGEVSMIFGQPDTVDWHAEVTFVDGISQEVVIEFVVTEGEIILEEFKGEIFGLPAVKPVTSTDDKRRWEDLAGLSEVELERVGNERLILTASL